MDLYNAVTISVRIIYYIVRLKNMFGSIPYGMTVVGVHVLPVFPH